MSAGVGFNLFIRVDTYENWLGDFFTAEELLDPSISDENADPDGDFLTNFIEFHAKLDPTDTNSRLYYSYLGGTDPSLQIGPIDMCATIKIEGSTSLQTWSPLDLDSYSRVGDQIEIDLETYTPSGLFRLTISD